MLYSHNTQAIGRETRPKAVRYAHVFLLNAVHAKNRVQSIVHREVCCSSHQHPFSLPDEMRHGFRQDMPGLACAGRPPNVGDWILEQVSRTPDLLITHRPDVCELAES